MMLCILIEVKFNKLQLQDMFLIPKATNGEEDRELNVSFMLRMENW